MPSEDRAHMNARATSNVGSVLANIVGHSIDSSTPQTATISKAAPEMVSASDAPEDKNGGSADRLPAGRRDGDQRGIRYNPQSRKTPKVYLRPGLNNTGMPGKFG